MSTEKFREIYHPEQTEIQEIKKYLELVKEHPRNLSKTFLIDILSKTGDIPILIGFG